ncbi:aminoglycoside N(3)-acetyltransferase [Paractinoplanes durhamensis]|uniref:aminoglycoside N(3)-acetyltransferase n=1 Tax=Paractinoplanes durhamensis TaxID=113563 RepID=UPI001EF338A0|nr:AAC(3) family N-acetyltransferase [Actinoplanes durhamensis]
MHCAMRTAGPLDRGPDTLLTALRDVLGAAGTIVVPTQTANNSLTSPVYRAATAGMSKAQRAHYEDGMPGFDPRTSPSYGMGALAEHVRRQPGAWRSSHPQTSFAALGPAAADLVAEHDLPCHLGERSPLGALYRTGAKVLLIGVGMDKCTALHLAEYRLVPAIPIMTFSCFVSESGRRRLLEFQAPALDDNDFGAVGIDLIQQPWARSGPIGAASSHLMPMVSAVDRALELFSVNRSRV